MPGEEQRFEPGSSGSRLAVFNNSHPSYLRFLLSVVSVTSGQPWSKNVEWKIPEINSSEV